MGGVSYSVFGQKKAPQARKIKPDFNSHGAGTCTCTSMFDVFTLYCKCITLETILVSFMYIIKTGCLWILLWLSLVIIIKIS